jgi:hypothetical protein
MSQIHEIQPLDNSLAIRAGNIDALVKAAQRCGFSYVPDRETYRSYYGETEGKYGQIVAVLKQEGKSYEIGVCKKADGTFVLQYDAHDGTIEHKCGPRLATLMNFFGVEVTREFAMSLGGTVTETPVDGGIELEIQIPDHVMAEFAQ